MTDSTQPMRVSRTGKRPVDLPKGVTVAIDGATVKIKGPKGELERTFHPDVRIEKDGESLKVVAAGSPKRFAQFQGLSRSLLRNMVDLIVAGTLLAFHLADRRAVATKGIATIDASVDDGAAGKGDRIATLV